MAKTKSKSLPKQLAGLVGSLVGSAIAKRTRSNTAVKPAKRKKNRTAPTLSVESSTRRVQAPLTQAIQFRSSSHRHTPMIISGQTKVGRVGTGLASVNQAYNADNLPGAVSMNCFNIDPIANGVTSQNFMMFGTTIRNMCAGFLRYRWKKAILKYAPLLSANNNGAVTIAVFPEVQSSDTILSESAITNSQNYITTSLWSPAEMDLLKSGAMRREWLFMNIGGFGTAASERQEAAGSIGFFAAGAAASVLYRSLYLDFELEFNGLAPENGFSSVPPLLSTALDERKEQDSLSLAETQFQPAENEKFLPPSIERRYTSVPPVLATQGVSSASATPTGWTSVRH